MKYRLFRHRTALIALATMVLGVGNPWTRDTGPDIATGAGTFLFCAAASAGQEPDPAVLQAENERIAAIAKAMKSSVGVFAPGGRGGGSGVVITPDGYALTNFHVVKPCGTYMKCAMSDGRLYDAVLVGVDPTGDVAMIKLLDRNDFVPAELGDSDRVRAGDWCFAIGNPFLLATDFQLTVSYGLVSGVGRYQPPAGTLLEYADCIQTDAAINPGNSGGPLFDAKGRLLGINGRGSFEKRGRVNVGVGYAISINQIKKFIGYLQSGRIVDHATLGATVAANEEGKVLVSNILDSSDAYRRGLRYGDRVVSFGGREINTVNGFKNVLGIFPKGWRIPMRFMREGETFDVYVRLTGVHTHEELLKKTQGKPKAKPSAPKPDAPKPGTPIPIDPRKKPAKRSEKKPGTPIPIPIPGKPNPHGRGHKIQPPPKNVAKLIKARPGYANYYFNELNRDRVWDAFAANANIQDAPDRWLLTGQLVGRGPMEILLGPDEATATLPDRIERVNLKTDLDQQLVPAGTGGLLPALHVWQRLLRFGPKKFGEVYYLGTAPLIGHKGLYDVLVGTYNVVEARFAFDPKSGQLVALEMFPDTNTDPCELYFSDYRKEGGRTLPHLIRVRYGNRTVMELKIDKYTMTK